MARQRTNETVQFILNPSKKYDVTEKKKEEFAHAKKKCKKKNVTADGEIPKKLALGKRMSEHHHRNLF
jgi:hypothetical protein